MFQFRKYILPLVLAGLVAARVAVALTAQEPKPAPSTKDTKAIDLAGLHDAISAASKRGENVDGVREQAYRCVNRVFSYRLLDIFFCL